MTLNIWCCMGARGTCSSCSETVGRSGGGGGEALPAAGAVLPFPENRAMSSFNTRPSLPVPITSVMLTPSSLEMRLTAGVANNPCLETAAAERGGTGFDAGSGLTDAEDDGDTPVGGSPNCGSSATSASRSISTSGYDRGNTLAAAKP
jgi:hypothetical protein